MMSNRTLTFDLRPVGLPPVEISAESLDWLGLFLNLTTAELAASVNAAVSQLDLSAALDALDLLALAENATASAGLDLDQLDHLLNQLDQMNPLLQPAMEQVLFALNVSSTSSLEDVLGLDLELDLPAALASAITAVDPYALSAILNASGVAFSPAQVAAIEAQVANSSLTFGHYSWQTYSRWERVSHQHPVAFLVCFSLAEIIATGLVPVPIGVVFMVAAGTLYGHWAGWLICTPTHALPRHRAATADHSATPATAADQPSAVCPSRRCVGACCACAVWVRVLCGCACCVGAWSRRRGQHDARLSPHLRPRTLRS
jgi:hypothetical protein